MKRVYFTTDYMGHKITIFIGSCGEFFSSIDDVETLLIGGSSEEVLRKTRKKIDAEGNDDEPKTIQ